MDESTQTKVCTKCGAEKPLTDYHIARDNRDGRRGACKPCSVAMATANARKRRAERPVPVEVPATKKCPRCDVEQAANQFYVNRLSRDGLASWCKECSKQAARESAERRKDQLKAPPPGGEKACTRCRVIKLSAEFYPSRVTRDGLTAACSDCLRQSRRDWVRENADAVAAYRKLYDSIHREQKIERCREWREANPEHRKKYAERYAAENAERIATWKREWFAANRERLTERLHSDPDLLERRAASNRRHKERNRDLIAERQRRRRVDKLGLTIEDVDLDSLWTGRCGICSRPLDRDLRWPDPFSKSIDHIVPLSLGGTHEADNLQWAHLVCNIRKGNRMSE